MQWYATLALASLKALSNGGGRDREIHAALWRLPWIVLTVLERFEDWRDLLESGAVVDYPTLAMPVDESSIGEFGKVEMVEHRRRRRFGQVEWWVRPEKLQEEVASCRVSETIEQLGEQLVAVRRILSHQNR